MSWARAVSARRVCGKARLCRPWGVVRYTHHARQTTAERPVQARCRSHRPVLSAEAPVARIRDVLRDGAAAAFLEEGSRKALARLSNWGIPVPKGRVRRLMREYSLQALHRMGGARGPRVHDGTIIPDAPNRIWGTNATHVTTRPEGMATRLKLGVTFAVMRSPLMSAGPEHTSKRRYRLIRATGITTARWAQARCAFS